MATTPRTISQRIALEGAEELKRQFERIGQSGEKTFEQLKAEAIDASREFERLVGRIAQVEQSFQRLGNSGRSLVTSVGNLGTAFGRLSSSLGVVARNIGIIGGISLAGVTAGMLKFASSAARAADDLAESAAAAGLTVEAYQRLQFAATSAGVSQSQFGQVMGRLSQQFEAAKVEQIKQMGEEVLRLKQRGITAVGAIEQLREATAGTGPAAAAARQALAQLGPGFAAVARQADGSVRAVDGSRNAFVRFGIDVSKLSFEEAILKLSDAFAKLPSDTARAAAGVELFGNRVGPKLAVALAQMRENLGAIEGAFQRVGLTEDEVKLGEATALSLDVMGFTADKVRTKLGLVFARAVNAAATGFTRFLLDNIDALARFARTIEREVTPVIEAFFMLMRGEGDDENQTLQMLAEWQQSIEKFASTVGKAFNNVIIPAFNGFMKALNLAATGINKLFGTNLTGAELGIALVIAQITGALGLLGNAATVAAAAVVVFFSAFRFGASVLGVLASIAGWPRIIAAAFIIAAGLITGNWEQVREFLKEIGVDVDALERRIKKLNQVVQERTGVDVGGYISQLSKDWDEFIKNVETKGIGAAIAADLSKITFNANAPFPAAVANAFENVRQKVVSTFRNLSTDIERIWRAVISTFIALVDEAIAKVQELINRRRELQPDGGIPRGTPEGQFAPGHPGFSPAGFQEGGFQQAPLDFSQQVTAAQSAAVEIVRIFQTAGQAAATVFNEGIRLIPAAVQVIVDTIANAFQGVGVSVQGALGQIPGFVSGITGQVTSAVQQMLAAIQQAAQQAIQALDRVVQRANEAAQAAQQAAGSGFLMGGYTGSGGRSRVAGVVHGGEYVQPARVVARPGVLAFMELLRRSGDLGATIDRFTRGFSMGGLVDHLGASLALRPPRYAAGGLVPASSGRSLGTLMLATQSGERFPVMVEEDVAEGLFNFATRRQTRSAGRSPSRVR